jgi:hypothetical protein
MLSVVGGKPDNSKGLFATFVAAYVSNMKVKNPDGSYRRGKVLYSAQEDAFEQMTAPRLRAAGANMKNIDLWRFFLPGGFDELEEWVHDGVDLLVLDPWNAHLVGVNRYSDKVRTVLQPLSELMEETKAACLIVEHVVKKVNKNSHPRDALGGSSSGLPAAARMAFLFGINPADEDQRVLAPVKANIRAMPQSIVFEVDTREVENEEGDLIEVPYLLKQDEEIDFNAIGLVVGEGGSGKIGRPNDKRASAAQWLTDYLYSAGDPVLSSVVIEDAKQAGMAVKTLRRAGTDIKVVKDPPGGGRNCHWSLPDSLIQLMDQATGGTPDGSSLLDGLGQDGIGVGDNPDGEVDGEVELMSDSFDLSDEDIQKLLGDGKGEEDGEEDGK